MFQKKRIKCHFKKLWKQNKTKISDVLSSEAPVPPSTAVQEVLEILQKQEGIGIGQKAIVSDQTLYCDWIHDAAGDVGRWWMNTFLRQSTVTSERMAVCAHIEWLVSEIVRVSSERKTSTQQVLLDAHIRRLIETISNVMDTYSNEISSVQCRLKTCLVRLAGDDTVVNV
jgi:hypothetical protein